MPTWLNIVIIIISLWSLYLSLTKKRRARKAEDEGEDFVTRSIDRVGKRMMENDPELKRLKTKLRRLEGKRYRQIIDEYGSLENAPNWLISASKVGGRQPSRLDKKIIKAKAKRSARTEAALVPYLEERELSGKGPISDQLRQKFENEEISLEELKAKQLNFDAAREVAKRNASERQKQKQERQQLIRTMVKDQFGSDHLNDCNTFWHHTNDVITEASKPEQWIKRAERLKELLEHPANRESFDAWEVCIGATQEMVEHILGNPKDKNIKQLKNKRREYWYYKGRKTNQGGTVYSYRLRLEDGVVTEFGDGKFRP